MITTRTAKQCGQADFGWLQARYTFSFGHYFDPKLLGYASLRVLNQEVLAPGASFQPRTYPKVDILNLILEGEAEYRDSDGNHIQAKAGEALLISTQPRRELQRAQPEQRELADANPAVAGRLPAA
ncbi:Pirin-like protein YhaK [Klebsiella michiganensis]|uniref:Pirin-like protein YhaK n=1 Tax=Klebsiella michiganensis TaxID=1134687 RepID=A0A7H4PHD6_9ENTR|nr:Pirin-like protein YhaK [Klebsiella michiganensis]